MRRGIAVALAAVATIAAVGLAAHQRGSDEGARCGSGFHATGTRCMPNPFADGACPFPLVRTPAGCDAPDLRIAVPATSLSLGPGDWEAERMGRTRTLHAASFRLDAFEVTRGRYERATTDAARAATGMSLEEGGRFCASEGGRLPTEDEWIIAAASERNPPPRYPWGDTGAVCRRGAWGLGAGPCASTADGPDTVGAHVAGDSPSGLHDMAGNVAEWVAPNPSDGSGAKAADVAKGGSWQSSLASDLRIWARLELPPGSKDPRVGLRCAYPP